MKISEGFCGGVFFFLGVGWGGRGGRNRSAERYVKAVGFSFPIMQFYKQRKQKRTWIVQAKF